MSVADKITRLQNAKASIKTAIENKGVVVGDGTIDTYASKIDEITVGGGSSGGNSITDEELAYYQEIEASYLSRINDSLGANVTTLPEGITVLDNYAFYGCSKIALTSIPNTVKEIDNFAFYNCTGLSITKLPTVLEKIGGTAFRNCTSLTTLDTMSLNLNKIDGQSFRGCSNLTTFIVRALSVPTLASNVFQDTPIASGTGYIYVLDNLVFSYKSATNWSTYADQIKPISELGV